MKIRRSTVGRRISGSRKPVQARKTQSENPTTSDEARGEGVGKRPHPRVTVRQDHAGGLRRLRLAGVRPDIPYGQEDPENDGHDAPLRLQELPRSPSNSGIPRRRPRPRSARLRRASSGRCTTRYSKAKRARAKVNSRGALRRRAWIFFGSAVKCAPMSTPARSGASGIAESAAESRRRRPSSSIPSGTKAPSAWRRFSRRSKLSPVVEADRVESKVPADRKSRGKRKGARGGSPC